MQTYTAVAMDAAGVFSGPKPYPINSILYYIFIAGLNVVLGGC